MKKNQKEGKMLRETKLNRPKKATSSLNSESNLGNKYLSSLDKHFLINHKYRKNSNRRSIKI